MAAPVCEAYWREHVELNALYTFLWMFGMRQTYISCYVKHNGAGVVMIGSVGHFESTMNHPRDSPFDC